MATILYDIYTVSIKGKSWREKLKLLNKEADSYALLTSKHISFASTDGVSYADMVIADVGIDHFVYVDQRQEDEIFLLIYLDSDILFSGLLTTKQLKAKLLLYKSRLVDDINCYVRGNADLSWLDIKKQELPGKLTDHQDENDYRLRPVDQVKSILKRPIRRVVQLTTVGVLVILTAVGYHHYEKRQASLREQQATQKSIDLWSGYRMAVRGPAFDEELQAVLQPLKQATLVSDTAIKSFKYQKGDLNVELATFNHPVTDIQQWSAAQGYSQAKLTHTSISLDKTIALPPVVQDDSIMNAEHLQAWLLDRLHSEGSALAVSFDTVQQHQNYQLITGQFGVQNLPLLDLQQQARALHQLPVRLDSMTGYISDGQFTGLINFRLVGGLS